MIVKAPPLLLFLIQDVLPNLKRQEIWSPYPTRALMRKNSFPSAKVPHRRQLNSHGDGVSGFLIRRGRNVPQSTLVSDPGCAAASASTILPTCGAIDGRWFVESRSTANGRQSRTGCWYSMFLSAVTNTSKRARSIRSSSLPFRAPAQPSAGTVVTS